MEKTFTVNIVRDPKVPMSMKEFILDVLAGMNGKDAYVHELYRSFNDYRKSIHKKPGKYTSFRTIISNMASDDNKFIITTTPNRDKPFDPSAYKITNRGKQHLTLLRNQRE